MFGLISKKKTLAEMRKIKDRNRSEKLYANYDRPISKKQRTLNSYSQGYEDGIDNFYNALGNFITKQRWKR